LQHYASAQRIFTTLRAEAGVIMQIIGAIQALARSHRGEDAVLDFGTAQLLYAERGWQPTDRTAEVLAAALAWAAVSGHRRAAASPRDHRTRLTSPFTSYAAVRMCASPNSYQLIWATNAANGLRDITTVLCVRHRLPTPRSLQTFDP
jgi:hypothetical protein